MDYVDDDEFEDDGDEVVAPMNWWDLAIWFFTSVSDIIFSFSKAVGNLSLLLGTRSRAHDRKKSFADEARLSIESITGDDNGR